MLGAALSMGRGCMMPKPARVVASMSRVNVLTSLARSNSDRSGMRSFCMRVQYSTSTWGARPTSVSCTTTFSQFSFRKDSRAVGRARSGCENKCTRTLRNLVSATTRECDVRPYFRSPQMPMSRSSRRPVCSWMVKRSRMVCVGCWFLPSPPLKTGTCRWSDANLADPSSGWRSTTASHWYASYMSRVWRSDSPFLTLVPSVPEKPCTFKPRREAAIAKLVLVRVEFS
mmetsp:Transcript_23715/g.59363  ORF Transcript_23715/g.59363 Transcript_23715/m.59363 type:complete len:228 (+) Transcript_23715:764-1447(+)